MIIYVGQDVIYNNQKCHVQDTNFLNLTAKIGIVDSNNLIWDTFWVEFKDLKVIEEEKVEVIRGRKS